MDDYRVKGVAPDMSEAAYDWLLAMLGEGRLAVAHDVVAALATYRHNAKLRERVEAAVNERGDPQLLEHFAKSWP